MRAIYRTHLVSSLGGNDDLEEIFFKDIIRAFSERQEFPDEQDDYTIGAAKFDQPESVFPIASANKRGFDFAKNVLNLEPE